MTNKRILVIDDEDDIREVAQLCLEQVAGWQVFTASSGPEGITKAAQVIPDAILLDVMMPELDGPSTYKQLQASPATAAIPVILLTAKVQASEQSKFADLGVQGVLAKPFDPLNLAAEVSRVLGWAV